MKHIYISPHFDDVVLSCAGKIQQDLQAGIEVIVVTVFSKGDRSYKLRQEENEKALAVLGVKGLELGFTDAPFRDGQYSQFRSIILDEHIEADNWLIQRLTDSLLSLAAMYETGHFYCPLGVGSHVDHRLCFEASLRAALPHCCFYEDRPYALCHGAVEARLMHLAALSPEGLAFCLPKGLAHYLNSLAAMAYVECYLPKGPLRKEAFQLIEQQLAQSKAEHFTARPRIYPFSAHQFDTAYEAYRMYCSQSEFIGTKLLNEALSQSYALSLLGKVCFMERYWQLAPIAQNK